MNRFLDREKKIFRFNINFFYLFVLVLSSAILIFFNINISNRVNDLQFHKIPVLNKEIAIIESNITYEEANRSKLMDNLKKKSKELDLEPNPSNIIVSW